MDQLLPAFRREYGEVQSDQEDWGWFAWFSTPRTDLAVDVFCDDPERGQFRVHLTSRIRRLILGSKVVDTPELDALRSLVVARLAQWLDKPPHVTRLDAKYMPAENAT